MRVAQPDKPVAPLRTSLVRAILAFAVIGCGLSLRWYGFPLGLPAFVVKYGGSLLWATMVFLLVGVLLPRLTESGLAAIAAAIAVAVEFSRLVHTPWLDAFRLSTAGALLLGRSSHYGIWRPMRSGFCSASSSIGSLRSAGWISVRLSSKREGNSGQSTCDLHSAN